MIDGASTGGIMVLPGWTLYVLLFGPWSSGRGRLESRASGDGGNRLGLLVRDRRPSHGVPKQLRHVRGQAVRDVDACKRQRYYLDRVAQSIGGVVEFLAQGLHERRDLFIPILNERDALGVRD